MKILFNIILISCLFIFYIFSRCTSKEQAGHIQEIKRSPIHAGLELVDTLILPVDSVTQSQHYYDQRIMYNGSVHYLIYNSHTSRLYGYNLSEEKLSFTIQFPIDGPYSIDNPGRFYFHNDDSIFFIYSEQLNTVKIYNKKGALVRRINSALPTDKEDYWGTNELFYEFAYHPQTKSVGFWIYSGILENKSAQRTMMHCRYDIYSDTARVFGELPYAFLSTNYFPNVYLNGYSTPTQFIVYFLPSHEVQVYDHSGKILRRMKIKSRYMPEIVPGFIVKEGDKPDVEEEQRYNLKHPFYVKMFSNEDGSFHYRIVKHAADLKYPDGKRRNFYDRPFSVMILDKDFNLIDEVPLDGKTYDFFQSFAWTDKLYISLNNPLNPAFSDDKMQLAVFQIQPK